jgi:hypothetical protein
MVWVRLNNLPKGDIGLTNVYAPNNPWEHYTLWNKMLLRAFSMLQMDFP